MSAPTVRRLATRHVETSSDAPFAPNAFLRIDRAGKVTFVMPVVEMGQGTYTLIPMLIAEELEVDIDKVAIEHSPPDDKIYANPLTGVQLTGGSTSIRGTYVPLRQAGAAARVMLMSAAAQRWKVDPSTCRAKNGEVVHAPTGRKVSYGQLVDAAAKLPVPKDVVLKAPKDFKLIGRSEEHTSEFQSHSDLVCRLLLEIGRASCRERV